MTHRIRILGVVALAVATVSCGNVVRDSKAPVFLVVDSLSGIRGNTTLGTPSAVLTSDVLTLVTSGGVCSVASPCPTVFGDPGQAVMHISPKDIGSNAGNPTTPSSNNQVTLTRYHVAYRRADGRNTPGVDVPFGFDGAVTVTIPSSGSSTFGFELVRNVAKQESPLVQLVSSREIMTVLADVTFFGSDLVGNAISASGTMQIDFGNFGD
jgi:hypothetical protein